MFTFAYVSTLILWCSIKRTLRLSKTFSLSNSYLYYRSSSREVKILKQNRIIKISIDQRRHYRTVATHNAFHRELRRNNQKKAAVIVLGEINKQQQQQKHRTLQKQKGKMSSLNKPNISYTNSLTNSSGVGKRPSGNSGNMGNRGGLNTGSNKSSPSIFNNKKVIEIRKTISIRWLQTGKKL